MSLCKCCYNKKRNEEDEYCGPCSDKHSKLQSHLRLLAEAVLEAHFQIATSHKCQCPACKVAREVMG